MARPKPATFLIVLAAAMAAAKQGPAQDMAWECQGSEVSVEARGADRESALADAETAWSREVAEAYGAIFARPYQAMFWTAACRAADDGTADMLCRITATPCRRMPG